MRKDLTGQRFSRLVVIGESGERDKHLNVKWLCKCDCGNEILVITGSLKTGNTRSCGCLQDEVNATKGRKHGNCTINGISPEYIAWNNMKQRCNNPENDAYQNYGCRGVSVCPRWLGDDGFSNFLSDMGERPTPKHSLDRFPDNDNGIYEPTNCKWSTKKEQERNKRTNHWVEYNGEKKVLRDWADLLGVTFNTLRYHVMKGKPFGEIIEHFKK